MDDNRHYIRKSFSVLVKLKSQKDGFQQNSQFYPSAFVDDTSPDEYLNDIWPHECLIVKGKPINCKGLLAAINKAVDDYINQEIAE